MPAVTASVSLRLPGELLEAVDARASEAGLSRNAWLVAMLSMYVDVDREERPGAVERVLEEPSAPGMASRSAETPAPAEQPEKEQRWMALTGRPTRLHSANCKCPVCA